MGGFNQNRATPANAAVGSDFNSSSGAAGRSAVVYSGGLHLQHGRPGSTSSTRSSRPQSGAASASGSRPMSGHEQQQESRPAIRSAVVYGGGIHLQHERPATSSSNRSSRPQSSEAAVSHGRQV